MLFTIDELSKELNTIITDTDYMLIHSHAVEFIERYCGISLSPGESFLVSPGPIKHIEVAYKPLTEILEISYEPIEIVYEVYSWGLKFGEKVVKVSMRYKYGYQEPPVLLKTAGLKIAKILFGKIDKPFPSVESLNSGGVSFRFSLADIYKKRPTGDDTIDSILNMYKIKIPRVV